MLGKRYVHQLIQILPQIKFEFKKNFSTLTTLFQKYSNFLL